MRRGTLFLLLIIVLLAVGAAFVDFWPNSTTGKTWHGINNPYSVKLGLDLQGGVSVLLVPDPAKHYTKAEVDSAISSTVQQITKRVNGGLGVNEPNIRTLTDSKGNQSIALELPGLNSGNQDQQIRTILRPGNLEFWDTGQTPLAPGATLNPAQFAQYNPGGNPQFTGKDLDPNQISVGTDQQTGAVVINFEMQGGAIARFGDFTGKHIGDQLTITLDRKVISSASINSQINGPGIITGQFTQAEAQSIVTVLQYGALPLSLQIASEETVGATLGTDSIIKSVIAGIIGLSIVVLFMILYYRLPGLLADFALVLYALFTLAIFKIFAFTLTLAGIAGFILSIGMAVDANVLIFERIKEELRAGRMLSSAIDIGWKRAWPSIRDSNISTLITCAVLFYFGSNFGASIIVGFATTLFLGVLVSMFTAIVVTRTFLNVLVPTGVINHPALFGLPAGSIASASLARRNSTV
ncbi:MAG TPA: protein translocase subunit SecD [Ktedonobacteraceae bacterium]